MLSWKKFLPLMLIILLLACVCAVAHADILINELMTDNGTYDNDGNAYDWIELYNNGPKDVDISGWGLTDTKKDLYSFTFPAGTKIKSGEFFLVYCCGDDINANRPAVRTYFASFKLGNSGETIRLTDAGGNEIQVLEYPNQFSGFSWGLAGSGDKYGFFTAATPRGKNPVIVYDNLADRPVITTKAGFYSNSVDVEIESADPVRYTTDGSEPTRSSALYTGAIQVRTTTVIRAKAFPDGKLPSYSVTATYIINDPASTPVLSFSTDRDYLYGAKGLFTNGSGERPNFYSEWEYPMHMEYFDLDGELQINQTGSFHIVGTSTRAAKQKSFAIFARTAYGDEGRFNYNPFSDRSYTDYKSFTIRSTGSDAPFCRMRDLVLTRLAEGLDIMYLAGETVIVYINGEYFGQYNIREKANKHSVAQWEGITDKADIDRIDIIEGEARDDQIQNGSADDWRALRAFVKDNDLTIPEKLQYVTDRLDVDSLFTWNAFELCIMNADIENVRVYRVPGGKWKYILYDVEAGGSLTEGAVYKLLDAKQISNVSSHYSLINRLLRVPEMRTKFLEKLAFVIENSFLYADHVKLEIEKEETILEPLLKRHFAKFQISNVNDWRQNVRAFKRSMRRSPQKVLKMAFKILDVTPEEEGLYFSHVMGLLEVRNSPDVE